MTDENRLLERFREIVREEIQRDSAGPQCPACHEQMEGWTMYDIDEMVADDERWSLWCDWCDYEGTPAEFDPANQEGRS